MKRIVAGVFFLLMMKSVDLLASVELVDSLETKTVNGKKYIQYRVKEHEGWFGIARKYGISYRDLRMVNKEKSDTIHRGQVILVPFEKAKINGPGILKTDVHKAEQATTQPVYHTIKQKETLFSIAKKYKVSKEELKKWNRLMPANLKIGDSIIVSNKKVQSNTVQKKKNPSAKPERKAAGGKELPVIRNANHREGEKSDSSNVSKSNTKNKKAVDSVAEIRNPEFAANRKEMIEQGMATWIDDENINPNKYFALHRIAPVGTIVKVTNRMNKRTVFVKVVGKLPDTGDNDNTIIKISKASAEKLGVRDQRFQCDLVYGISEK